MKHAVRSVVFTWAAGLAAACGATLLIAMALVPAAPTIPKYIQPTTHATPFMIEAMPKPHDQVSFPLPSATGRLVIPAAHLNARLLTMSVPADGILIPPDFGDTFMVNGYGNPRTDSGTVFVAMHASPASFDHAVGSLLQNSAGVPTVKAGVKVIVNGINYTITGNRVVRKGSLADQKDLWNNSHDLVLITCSEVIAQHRNHALDNALIFATKDEVK